jgi:hypothetical protein
LKRLSMPRQARCFRLPDAPAARRSPWNVGRPAMTRDGEVSALP